jgi:hypothetical protein
MNVQKSTQGSCFFSKAIKANIKKTRAGIILPAILETETRVGSKANPPARIKAMTSPVLSRKRKGTNIIKLPQRTGQILAKKLLLPKIENSISVMDKYPILELMDNVSPLEIRQAWRASEASESTRGVCPKRINRKVNPNRKIMNK